ncbi:hypothetical protein A3K34_04410 [candidate division WWE3 bacterium RIFOXYC1_FULL_40_10]|uniref:Large ribosomal subunit protein bL25 n=1 Tax=candidate division WWE3 bacterium RIFOXYA2_FULL_46_9 TaxID=1802636 RepID=A0A1F4W167_UNCKA|nr:MAG: hypothetical protein A3K58_04410 [candidate division WWE3 bacterium RIFOXYB1_FULL_40_22]OGC62085.1 MAG: hypothetical protein A3K37_04410 [candidate division WWE3 bacterium RIFOXYA1_FULL_40_11]OGC63100.1 MAG: hypothetical protein A2264_00155 [candidate division WWE3 bacterium RIFOXYA2_FULL_46_9]OGC64971.1 MAG: hypothetical protein A2326_02960 [candidate division WWE3 bacterium RIFOXYB2_FULL_41_6]OGC66468.1 MAG: hypothetical protein A3K34_04410 [candidate division WWE3 bacterium RIFOXYC1_
MELIAHKREKTGKKTKNLRTQGIIPAIVYGNGIDPTNIEVAILDYTKAFDVSGETGLIDLKINGDKDIKVLIKNTQFDPLTDRPIHAEFFKPNLKEKTEAEVPVSVVGEDRNELIKSGKALVITLLDEIRVSALPMDLPSEFEVDVSGLTEIGDGISVSMLNYDRTKVEIVDLEEADIIAKLDHAEMQEEEEALVTEEEAIQQMEAVAEKTPEEGEEESPENAGKTGNK